MATVGRFIAGIGAVIWSPKSERYLVLRRSGAKDYGAGAWECVTGRVDQGEGFEEALHREVREELGVSIKAMTIIGTTHFYRGAAIPENELLGVIFLCNLDNPESIHPGDEHSEHRWVTANEAMALLSETDPTTRWARRVIERAEAVRSKLSDGLVEYFLVNGFESG